MHVTVLRDNNYYCNNLIIENYTKVIFIFKGLVAQETEVVNQHEHHVLIGWFSNRTGMPDDDVGAQGIVWILF